MASPELPYCTYRFRKVPAHYDATAFQAIIPLEKDESVIFSSLSSDNGVPEGNFQIGTVTWNTVPRYLRDLVADDLPAFRLSTHPDTPDDPTTYTAAQGNEIEIDSHFRGFTPLNADPEKGEQTIDIVAMTGVGGRPFLSWQHASGAMWLRDCLPRDIPAAQIFTYGYPSKLQGSNSQARLFDYTTEFLRELRSLSGRNPLVPRPLVLVGHSFGGLIIKQAIIEAGKNQDQYGRVFNSIYSICFFGTPHRGLNTEALEKMVADEPTKYLIKDLRENSEVIRSLREDFAKYTKSLRVLTCFERLETPTMEFSNGSWKRTGRSEMMVNESSACLNFPNEDRIPIYANHSMIAKLSDHGGSEYHSIKDTLVSHAKLAPLAVQRQLLKRECATVLSDVYTNAMCCYAIIKEKGIGAKGIAEHMADELSFLDAFGAFLVDEELCKILENPTLPDKIPQQIRDLLHQLKDAFSPFTRLAALYYEPYRKAIQSKTRLSSPPQQVRSLDKQETSFLSEELLQDPVMTGSLFREDSINSVLQLCKKSTSKLLEKMSIVTLYTMRFDTLGDLTSFQSRDEFRKTGLATVMARQHFVQSGGVSKPEPLQGRLEETHAQNDNPDLRLMQFYRDGEVGVDAVVVEYRYYEPEPRSERTGLKLTREESNQLNYVENVKRIMVNLASLHQRLSLDQGDASAVVGSSRALNVFHCLGFLEEPKKYRFAFVFKFPTELPFASLTKLFSLSTYIDNFESYEKLRAPDPRKGLPLEQKFALAIDLCQAVLNIHICGWVHKSIRSSNIILGPSNTDVAQNASPGNFKRYIPYLKGFEFSRPHQGKSSGRTATDLIDNLYRHPARQGIPTETFNKEHDLYAVGVVLLEIGLWRTVKSIFKNKLDQAGQGGSFPSKETIRDQLVTLAQTRLPPAMGTKYSEAVQKCIGGFGLVEDTTKQTGLELAFRQQVLDLLEAGAEL